MVTVAHIDAHLVHLPRPLLVRVVLEAPVQLLNSQLLTGEVVSITQVALRQHLKIPIWELKEVNRRALKEWATMHQSTISLHSIYTVRLKSPLVMGQHFLSTPTWLRSRAANGLKVHQLRPGPWRTGIALRAPLWP